MKSVFLRIKYIPLMNTKENVTHSGNIKKDMGVKSHSAPEKIALN